ncbi:phage head-tail joining protein [Roseovarius autotrophicus]|uniref:phage head-tail joining protein n=1 Tax=Roseovarius autotrophicus TaxID=2824121 RepID=UPI001B38993D|nr:hypothetical protein [Roseovarius autotrophicus]
MPIEADELVQLRDALLRARAAGTRSLSYEGKSYTYASDSEMAAALADLERRIARATRPAPGALRFLTSKGL